MTNKSENPREKLYRKMLHGHWVKIVSVLASVVVFITTYSLILPAITLSNQEPKCNIAEHTHVAECYDAEGNIVCGSEEHVHNLACYSDLNAAIESEEYWAAELPALTGDRNADVIAVAKSQIGYKENDENYKVVDNEQTKGYTRYGHWYGDEVDTYSEKFENGLSDYAYKDWDAMFVSFVLRYAEIYDMGFDSDAGNWAGALGDAAIYVDAANYVPQMGDLIFFTPNVGENMRVGIVSGVNRGFFGNEIKSISVILGDSNNAVEEVKVAVSEYTEGDITFETIHGYGVLTPGYGEQPEAVAEQEDAVENADAAAPVEEAAPEGTDAAAPEGEAVAETPEAEVVPVSLEENSEHLIGQAEENLETVEEASDGETSVTLLDAGISEDGSEIAMNWNMTARLPEAMLPAGSIIRIDTSTGKTHAMTVGQVFDWAQTAGVGIDNAAYVDNDNFEVTVIGDNGLLYSWADVQNMDAAAVTSFTGIHIKALNDVALGEDGVIFFDFASKAKVSDANAGQNYYVSKVSVNGVSGAETYVYTNGEAETVDQNEVLRDAGLEEEPTEKTLTAKKSDYTVTMTYGSDAAIPDGAKLYVQEIRKGTEEYNRYIEDAKAALGISEEDVAELLGRFFDIKIMTKEGEFEPKAPVNVNIEYKKAIETEDPSYVSAVHFSQEGTETIPVDTVDVSEADDELSKVKSVGFSAESFSIYGIVYTVDFEYNESQTSIEGGSQILLSALIERLNIINADGDLINVKDIVSVVFTNGRVVSIEEVSGEVQVNNRTIDVGTKDFLLTSEATFTSDERLIITTSDGTRYFVGVHDPITELPVNEFVTSATLKDTSGNPIEQDANGNYIIKNANNYEVTLHFEESPRKQFDQLEVADGTINHYMPDLVYTIPEGITFSGNGTFMMKVGTKVIQGNTYTINGNKAIIHFNESDPNYSTLLNSPRLYMDLDFGVSFSQDSQHTEFGTDGRGGIDIVKDTSHDASVNKSILNYNQTTGVITYQVDVTSTGKSKSINVQDYVSGSLLSNISNMSVTVLDSKHNWSTVGTLTDGNGYTSTNVDKGFDITINELDDGQVARIQYEVTVDKESIGRNGNATFDETGNKVKINAPGDDDNSNNEDTEHKSDINISSMKKTSTSTSDVYTKTVNGTVRQFRDISYQIEVNPERTVSLAGTPITDTNLTTNLAKYGEKVDLVVYGPNDTQVRTEEINPGQGSWTYNVPADDPAYKYVFTYRTSVDVTGWTSAQQVKNSATYKYGGDGTTINVPPPPQPDENPKEKVSKYAVDYNENTVTWKITIDVPAGGTGQYSITDTLPQMSQWGIYDSIQSISIDGLTDSERASTQPIIKHSTTEYTVTSDNVATTTYPVGATVPTGDESFTIDFKHGTTPGFESTGSNRTVTVTVVTQNNPFWMENVKEHGENAGWLHEHKNSVSVKKDGSDEPVDIEHPTDSVRPVPGNIEKTLKTEASFDYDASGKKLPAYRFEVTISGSVTGDIDILDKFNTKYFKVLTDHYNMGQLQDANHLYYGTDMWSYAEPTPNVIAHVIEQPDGAKLHIDAANVPKINDLPYSYYRVAYYLVPKDYATYEELKAFVAQNGEIVSDAHGDTTKKYTFNNIAEFAGNSSNAEYSVEVTDIINKSGTVAEDGDAKGLLKYVITYNKDKLKLHDSQKVAIYDLLENAVPYKFNDNNFLKVTVEGKNGTVSNDYILVDEGNGETAPNDYTGVVIYYNSLTETFNYADKIPDESKVTIEYWAKPAYTVVNGDENKESADYGKALSDVNNTVSVDDFNYTINNKQSYDVLTKEQQKNNDNTVGYTIKFNENALTLNNQVDFPVTDTVKGITIKNDDFTVEASPNTVMHKESSESSAVEITDVATFVKNSMQKQIIDEDTGEVKYTFTIPDGVFVKITYIGEPIYTLDNNGNLSAEYSNTAEGDNIVKKTEDSDEDKILKKTFGDYVSYDEENAGNPNIGTIPFQIVFNPTKEKLNNGEDMDLTDDFTNLSVVYSSIHIETDPAENADKVTYDYSGNTGYYVIPDETKVVLTYNAMPIFDENNSSSWKNEVEIKGFKDETHDVTEDHSHASGGGDEENNIYLFKYEKGNMRNGMTGVTFSLYTLNDDQQMVQVLDLFGDPIKFTTTVDNEKGKGYVKIVTTGLTGHELETGKIYYLHEDAAPEGYYEDDIYYNFVIVDESSDYTAPDGIYVYKKGDTLKISNKPITDDITAYKSWTNADGTNTWPETYEGKIDLKLVLYNTKTGEEKPVAMPQAYYGEEETMPLNLRDLAYLSNDVSYTEWSGAIKSLYSDMRSVKWMDLDKISEALQQEGWIYKVKEVGEDSGRITIGDAEYDVYGGEVFQGEATITNVERTNIQFEKKWRNISGTITWPVPDEVKYFDFNVDSTHHDTVNVTSGTEGKSQLRNGSYEGQADSVDLDFSKLRLIVELKRYTYKNGNKVEVPFDLTDEHEARLAGAKILYGETNGEWGSPDSGHWTSEFVETGYWTGEWKDLPMAGFDEQDRKVDYTYEVQEIAVLPPKQALNDADNHYIDISDMFDTKYTIDESGKKIITNSMKGDNSWYLNVSKKWLDNKGRVTTGEPVGFKLLRSGNRTTVTPGAAATINIVAPWGEQGLDSNTAYKVGDTVRIEFTTSAYLNGYDVDGADIQESSDVITENGSVGRKQLLDFKITGPQVTINIYNGGVNKNTEFLYTLVSQGEGTSSETPINEVVLMPSDLNDMYNGAKLVEDTSTPGPYTFTLNPGQTISFANLPKTKTISETTTESYVYTVIETSTGEGWHVETQQGEYDPAPIGDDVEGHSDDVELVNQYDRPLTGSLKLTKLVKVNNATATGNSLADGDYTFSIHNVTDGDNSNDKTVIIRVEGGVATKYKVGNQSFTDLPVDKYAIVPDLEEGDYIISEASAANGATLVEAIRGDGDATAVSPTKTVEVHVTAGVDDPATTTFSAASFTNNKSHLEVTKVWKGISDENVAWVKNIVITLHEKPSSGSEIEYIYTVSESDNGGTKTYTALPSAGIENAPQATVTGNQTDGYKITFADLKGTCTYYLTEETVEGYKDPEYATLASGSITAKGINDDTNDRALDGEYILNRPEETYELPETGGIGTKPFYTIGMMLIALAAGIYGVLKSKKLVAIRLGCDNGTKRGSNKRRGGGGL